jgi:hypothetical protein
MGINIDSVFLSDEVLANKINHETGARTESRRRSLKTMDYGNFLPRRFLVSKLWA